MATLGGAEALGMESVIGSLTVGKKADLIVIGPHQINFAPKWNWIGQLVFNGQPNNVETVLVDGRILKDKGQLIRPSLIPFSTLMSLIKRTEEASSRIRILFKGH